MIHHEKMNRLVICLTMVLFFSCYTNSISASNEFSTDTSSQLPGMVFNQVDFIWGQSLFINTAVGQVIADIDEVLKTKGLEIGYLNGLSRDGWVIQNLMLDKTWSYDSICTFFDLGRTGDVRSIQLHLEVTTEPQPRFSDGVFETYDVGDVVFDAEGGTEYSGSSSGINPPSPDAVEFEIGGLNEWYEQPNHHPDANVQSAINQCVPTGYANTLQYLENTFPISIPHDLVPGIGFHDTGIVIPPNSLPGYFDVLMERNVWSWSQGNGTPYDRSIRGALRYCWEEGIDVTVCHQGLEGDVDVVWDGKKTSFHQGDPVNFMYLLDEVKKGHGVTLRFWRFNNSVPYSGHQVCVVGAGYILGEAAIHYCHDSNQSDDTAGLVVHQSFLGMNSTDGNLTLLNSGNPPDGPPEIVRIVTFDAHNQAPAQPSPPHQGFGLLPLKKDVVYEFTTSTTDPEGHDLYYEFDWGDGTFTEVGPFSSGATAAANHSWSDFGSIVFIKVRARDIFYEYSTWSDSTKRMIPGFEFVILVIALLTVFMLLHRHRHKS